MADLLVVDDNEDIATLVRMLLELEGHAVRVAHNGEEGLQAVDRQRPDAVILDVEMPVLDGPGMAYRMFLENMGREFIPIILVSATPNLVQFARGVGTPYALAKPFEPEDLQALVQRALSERRIPRPPLPHSAGRAP